MKNKDEEQRGDGFKVCFVNWLCRRVFSGGRRAAAAATFRTAINPSIFTGLRGHQLHGALIKAFPAHITAAHELMCYLGYVDRRRFSKAWNAYHGGSEKQPDWFVIYCLPDRGTELLVQRIEALRNAASQT